MNRLTGMMTATLTGAPTGAPTGAGTSLTAGRTAVAVVQPWGPRRVLAALAGVLLVAALLAGGVGYWAWNTWQSTTPAPPAAGTGQDALEAMQAGAPAARSRDDIAAAPMATFPASASSPAPPATTPGPTMTVPGSTRSGPAQVPTGFPHTTPGAVAQLGAIESRVAQAMSIQVATDVYGGWALPGGVGAPRWTMTVAVRQFLSSAGVSSIDDGQARIVATPAAGMVKGADGDDWVVACVLLHVKSTIVRTAQMAFGHCERMQWQPDQMVPGGGGRWMIAPGPEPAPAPSTWPGSDAALQAGWATWPVTS